MRSTRGWIVAKPTVLMLQIGTIKAVTNKHLNVVWNNQDLICMYLRMFVC